MTKISVIIPAYNEAAFIGDCIRQFTSIKSTTEFEVIVVDGGSDDGTCEEVRKYDSARLLIADGGGRAGAMNTGARAATGDILLFIHADCRLVPFSPEIITDVFDHDPEAIAGAFDLEIDSCKNSLKRIARYANKRSRRYGTAYGDQALFVRTDVFWQLGGYPDEPLFEDVILSGKLKKRHKINFISECKAVVSDRRWEKEGILYATARNWILIFLYVIGVPPRWMKRFYKS